MCVLAKITPLLILLLYSASEIEAAQVKNEQIESAAMQQQLTYARAQQQQQPGGNAFDFLC
jgi:hypothetical protein